MCPVWPPRMLLLIGRLKERLCLHGNYDVEDALLVGRACAITLSADNDHCAHTIIVGTASSDHKTAAVDRTCARTLFSRSWFVAASVVPCVFVSIQSTHIGHRSHRSQVSRSGVCAAFISLHLLRAVIYLLRPIGAAQPCSHAIKHTLDAAGACAGPWLKRVRERIFSISECFRIYSAFFVKLRLSTSTQQSNQSPPSSTTDLIFSTSHMLCSVFVSIFQQHKYHRSI